MEAEFRAKTIPVYFDLYKFREYSSTTINEKKYIIARDCISNNLYTKQRTPLRFLSIEYIESHFTRFDDCALLERILRWDKKFLKSDGSRRKFDDDAIQTILDFCLEFGMPLIDMPSENTKEINHLSFFDARRFYSMMQSVYIFFDDLSYCQRSSNDQETENAISRLSTYPCGVQICCGWSEKSNQPEMLFIADSLLDIAKYQLLYCFTHNYSLKKCENPSCGTPIINGRENMKYCSLACKQAHYRMRKRKKKEVD